MITVRFLKKYKHTSTRTWEKGDTPTISRDLAAKLLNDKIVEYLVEGDNRRGVTQEELNEAIENQKEEKPKQESKLIVPPGI